MKIQTANLTKLLNNQHLTFHREFEELIKEKEAKTLDVETVYTAYQVTIEAEDTGLIKVAKNTFTFDKDAADRSRDGLFVGIMETIRAAQYHFDPDHQAAARRLSTLTSTFKGSDKAAFDDETSRLRNFLQELRSEKHSADVALVGLAQWLTPLEEANEKCAELADKFNTEERDKNAAGKTAALRRETDKLYKALVERINALALINGDEKYADLITRWNTRIDHYRNVISRRLGAGKGGSTGSGDNTPTPTDPEPGDRPEIE